MITGSNKQSYLRLSMALAAGCGLLFLLASCVPPRQQIVDRAPAAHGAGLTLVSQGGQRYSQCVPYARDRSGVRIFGDAWTWWSKADGRYSRGQVPKRGSVLTLKKTDRLRAGHVAVVSAVVDSRKILVDHANWGDSSTTRSKIHLQQPVIDVSRDNDWSAVRFMNTQGSYGRTYPAHGFIHPDSEVRTASNDKVQVR